MTFLTLTLAFIGAAFLLLAGIGVVRLPDLYCRASATTKAATLGLGCLLAAVALHFDDLRVTTPIPANNKNAAPIKAKVRVKRVIVAFSDLSSEQRRPFPKTKPTPAINRHPKTPVDS